MTGRDAAAGRQVYRPVPGMVATVALWAATLVALVLIARSGGMRAVWQVGPVLIAGDAIVWVAYWRPRVTIDDHGVRLVNLLRTVDVPWSALQDLDTRWTLKLVTATGRYAAWAAPAPSAWATVRSRGAPTSRAERTVSGPTPVTGAASDVLNVAAEMVRYRWREQRGAPGDGRAAPGPVRVTWHRATIAVLLGFLVLAAVSLSTA